MSENVQKLRVGIGVDVSASYYVEEFAQLIDIDEVAIDAHAEAKGRVYFKSQWLCNERVGGRH